MRYKDSSSAASRTEINTAIFYHCVVDGHISDILNICDPVPNDFKAAVLSSKSVFHRPETCYSEPLFRTDLFKHIKQMLVLCSGSQEISLSLDLCADFHSSLLNMKCLLLAENGSEASVKQFLPRCSIAKFQIDIAFVSPENPEVLLSFLKLERRTNEKAHIEQALL